MTGGGSGTTTGATTGMTGGGGGGETGTTGGTMTTGGTTTTTTGGGGGGGSGSFTIDPWMLGQNYGDRTASVGDTATFVWQQGTHGLYRLSTADCPSTFSNGQNGQLEIQAPTAGPKTATYTFQQSGTYWFACPVDGHCNAGMHFKVTVS
jgi:plastocyanin